MYACNNIPMHSPIRLLYTGRSGYVDKVRTSVVAGAGGDGCVSFLREKFLPKGPPNGGSGGHGGDVYIMAVDGMNSLAAVPNAIKAGSGQHGKGSSMNGKRGQDVIIKVPVGTVVKKTPVDPNTDIESPNDDVWVHYPRFEEENTDSSRLKEAERILKGHIRSLSRPQANKQVVFDLIEATSPNQPQLLCHGGLGGFGNTIFMTKDNRSPRFASRGRGGQRILLDLELKTVADIGLVGLPNAGKSTFLRAISNARPKTANYAFTTLSPVLGTIHMGATSFTVADIPGIIDGAADNKGLGHDFLRHIERAQILCFIVDLSSTPVQDYRILRQELQNYESNLCQRRAVIIANKADLPGAEERLGELKTAVLQSYQPLDSLAGQALAPRVMPFSALEQHGVAAILDALADIVIEQRAKLARFRSGRSDTNEIIRINRG